MLNIILWTSRSKGTQSAYLVEHYGLVHLSTDIFRANIKGGTELGQLAQSYMNQGQLVPDDVTIRMLESEVDKRQKPKDSSSMASPERPLKPKRWTCF